MLSRRHILAGLAGTSLATRARAQAKRPVIVAEPLHGIGYLPLYVAIAKGYFAADGLDVHVLTVEGGSSHTNAVLSGQAFAFIGGPEHDAFAKLRGAELRSVVNIVDRGNVYLVAGKGIAADGADLTTSLKGKTVVTTAYGGTPNSIIRYLVQKAGLVLNTDMKLIETTVAGALAAVSAGQAQIAVTTEPVLTQGIRQGIWGEPFYNVPKRLGPYAYSTINVRQDSIEKDPATVEAFVRNLIRGLKLTHASPDEATAIAHKEFPTMAADDMRATLDRSFADEMWSKDGLVSQQGWTTAKDVVMAAGLLKQDVPYDAIIDMSFVKRVTAG
jgi:NitT/TauT family transport system substrate-binding protein